MSAFDKIIGYTDVKTELIRFCDVLKNPEIYKSLGVTMPRGILLEGKPGIGKTMMAKCFIEESGVKSYTLRKDKPDGDFVNEIKNTFEKAKSDSCAIIFLDDMDKYANEDDTHKDAEEYVTVQACIDDCKGLDVFVLATVNEKFMLPDSLTRPGRFDKVIEMRYTEGEEAKKIVAHLIGQKQVIGDVDIEEISRVMEGHSCAELETVINEAGIYAGYDRRTKIEQRDILKACMRMIFDAPEAMEAVDEEFLRNTAVHEAGHAVVAEILNPGSVSLVSVCHYTGSTMGVTSVHRGNEYKYYKKSQEEDVLRILGGKAATELVYGSADIGCRSDLRKAFGIVERFVDDYCAYGFDAYEGRYNHSELSSENKDRYIAKEMDKYYRESKTILTQNRELLDLIVEALMEKKTIMYKDIALLREKAALLG